MSKTTVIVNPGHVVRLPGQRFTEGQPVELDAHQASRLVANGIARAPEDDAPTPEAPTQEAPAADEQETAAADELPADEAAGEAEEAG